MCCQKALETVDAIGGSLEDDSHFQINYLNDLAFYKVVDFLFYTQVLYAIK